MTKQVKDINKVWDKIAQNYDTSLLDNPEQESNIYWINKLMGDVNDKTICEIGSGSGIIASSLAMQGAKCTLVDISEKSLEFSKKIFKEKNLEANFVLGDALEYESNEKFDIVWNLGVLEHFFDEGKIQVLKTMWNTLRGGGALLL